MEIKFVKSNELIEIADLIAVRASYKEEPEQINSAACRYQKELSDTDNRIVFMSFDTVNAPIGYVQLILKNADNDPELANGLEIAHVHDLRVKYDYQSRGIGRSLMHNIENEARLKGVHVLTLGVDNWNHRAIKFYEKLGYSIFKETPGRTDQEICYLMRKQIC